jgi:phospholipid/cholesterol/gamma-HCH transport system ATP-binding protein
VRTETPKAAQVETLGVEVCSAGNSRVARVRDCNWKVHAGDFWLISGSHGSGKSDFLATAAGLQRPGAGTVRLFGEDIDGLPELAMLAKRLRIGFVFKDGGRMFPNLNVAENIALPLRYHQRIEAGAIEQTVTALVEVTGLSGLAQRRTRDIGANWHSRVGLARALALNPELLFLDEPALGLESRHRRWWLDFLTNLWAGKIAADRSPVTLVMTASDPDFWLETAKQFGVLRNQRLDILANKDQLRDAEALWAESEQRPVAAAKPVT